MDFGTTLPEDVWAQRLEERRRASKPHLELLRTSLMWILHFLSPGDIIFLKL